LDSHKKKDLKRKDDILQQQKHNEELLELLQTQQGSLVQNAKDMAEYEKTIVQMAAELDQYRQVPVPPLLIPQLLVERMELSVKVSSPSVTVYTTHSRRTYAQCSRRT
jgi:DNA repair ATPase RecN